jgi:hypothetical protein
MTALLNITGWELLALATFTSIGGFMRGFAGFGTTLIMVPLFSLIIEPVEAVFVGLAIDATATIPLAPNAFRHAEWKPIIPLMTASFLVTPLGAYILVITSADTMRLANAVMVILSAFLLLSGWHYQGKRTALLSFIVGGVSGTIGTATGAGGPPVAVYFMSGPSLAGQIRASLNCMAIIKLSISAIAIAYASSFASATYYTALTLLPVMLGFAWVGSKFFHGVSDEKFRRLLNFILILVGLAIIARTFLLPN